MKRYKIIENEYYDVSYKTGKTKTWKIYEVKDNLRTAIMWGIYSAIIFSGLVYSLITKDWWAVLVCGAVSFMVLILVEPILNEYLFFDNRKAAEKYIKDRTRK